METTELKIKSIELYKVIGNSIEHQFGTYRNFVNYIKDGILEVVELRKDTEVGPEVTQIVGSYVEITMYVGDTDGKYTTTKLIK